MFFLHSREKRKEIYFVDTTHTHGILLDRPPFEFWIIFIISFLHIYLVFNSDVFRIVHFLLFLDIVVVSLHLNDVGLMMMLWCNSSTILCRGVLQANKHVLVVQHDIIVFIFVFFYRFLSRPLAFNTATTKNYNLFGNLGQQKIHFTGVENEPYEVSTFYFFFFTLVVVAAAGWLVSWWCCCIGSKSKRGQKKIWLTTKFSFFYEKAEIQLKFFVFLFALSITISTHTSRKVIKFD